MGNLLRLAAAITLAFGPHAALGEDVEYPAAIPPAKTWAPVVTLSTEHKAMCKVLVGDKLPEMTLADLEGKEATLASVLGKKLTVVVFWRMDNIYAKEQFTRLEREVADAFAKEGVKAAAVNVGDQAADVRALAEECGCDFPCLLDAEGAGFAKVATEKLPRTYLCDAAGKILWMDLEYSVTTRRELRNAIWRHLGKK
jgi:peroxiredoxin